MNQGDEMTTNLTFEAAYSQLEETVRNLEQGGLSLEESVKLFEHGIELARLCTELLNAVEIKVTSLQEELAKHIQTSD